MVMPGITHHRRLVGRIVGGMMVVARVVSVVFCLGLGRNGDEREAANQSCHEIPHGRFLCVVSGSCRDAPPWRVCLVLEIQWFQHLGRVLPITVETMRLGICSGLSIKHDSLKQAVKSTCHASNVVANALKRSRHSGLRCRD